MKELKELIDFVMSLHMAYDKAKADGKVDVNDVAFLMDPIMKLVSAVEGIGLVKEEMLALDGPKRQALHDHVKANYDIADDDLENKIEKALNLVMHLGEFLVADLGVFKDEEPADEAPQV